MKIVGCDSRVQHARLPSLVAKHPGVSGIYPRVRKRGKGATAWRFAIFKSPAFALPFSNHGYLLAASNLCPPRTRTHSSMGENTKTTIVAVAVAINKQSSTRKNFAPSPSRPSSSARTPNGTVVQPKCAEQNITRTRKKRTYPLVWCCKPATEDTSLLGPAALRAAGRFTDGCWLTSQNQNMRWICTCADTPFKVQSGNSTQPTPNLTGTNRLTWTLTFSNSDVRMTTDVVPSPTPWSCLSDSSIKTLLKV